MRSTLVPMIRLWVKSHLKSLTILDILLDAGLVHKYVRVVKSYVNHTTFSFNNIWPYQQLCPGKTANTVPE